MDTLKSIFDYLLSLGDQWPDALAVVIGWASGWGLATGVEYFLDPSLPDRLQKGYAWLANVFCTTVVGSIVWHELDPADSAGLYIVASFGLSFAGAAIYPTVARIVTKYVPAVNSIYSKPKDQP